ncbi:CAZyme family GH13 [Penicillium roqueforti]|nr:CAZyme family GH13 [Penicillium roqueforti]KAI2736378.1 CAZyme family GH13 [Penicillium roqueforti]KAI2771267.1 CAZyme family GH13 [Penicillium roqueforti]KAI3066288.1 CAZyme family GH13 [Penicillium roqueforti]KAI3094247.1 CAZyme family GH13 [Penicillium roqueforti]
MQGFEWHVPADQRHWQRLRKAIPDLKDIGVDNIWIPPGCKGMDPSGIGYDIYDLYDLGEFDQKGTRATRWGPKEDLQRLVWAAKDMDIGIYWDAVLNQKAGADSTENLLVVKMDPEDWNTEISRPLTIDGWVGFDFPGRGEKYSSMKYHWQHFTGVDWDDASQQNAIYKILGQNKDWAKDVSDEHGNCDYLMFADLDHSHPEWNANRRISEYWRGEVGLLLGYLKLMDYGVSLFDVPLLGQFAAISKIAGGDLRNIFKGTLVEQMPSHAVTFVGNHDTQDGHSLETIIAPFFKPVAYSLILLRSQGQPCIFYGDFYGINCGSEPPGTCGEMLPILTRARKLYAHGKQRDYFNRRNCIGFVRYENYKHPFSLACILSNGGASSKRMLVGHRHAGELWTDILGWQNETVLINNCGYGVFSVASMSVSVWVNSQAEGRNRINRPFNEDIYSL